FQAFGSCQGGDGGGQPTEGGLGQFLDRDYFQIVADTEAAALPGGAGSGQDVIGAGCVIAGRFGAVGADEYAACVQHSGYERGGRNAQVFGGETIGELQRFFH